MSQNRISPRLAAAAALSMLVACNGDGDDGNGKPEERGGVIRFAPTAGVLPTPNDLAFRGSRDATLKGADSESVNALDGFSTIAPITAHASVPMERDSVRGGRSVRVFEVTTRGDPNSTERSAAGPKPVAGIARELRPGVDYLARVAPASRNRQALSIAPTAPLAADTTYLVILTDGLAAAGDGALGASPRYQLAKRPTALVDGSGTSLIDTLGDAAARKLEGVRRLIRSHLTAARGAGIAAGDVIASWTFTTQTIGEVLAEVAASASDAALRVPALGDTGVDTPLDTASVFAGVLSGLPYYLAEPNNPRDPRPLQAFWQADTEIAGERNLTGENPKPRRRSTIAIPVLIAIPNDASGKPVCNACPVSIFQHGVTRNRRDALGLADTLATLPAPHATVAIDLPLHGIVDTADPLYAGDENPTLQAAYGGLGDLERTFELDLIDNTGSAGPDNRIDPSGEHFINLRSPRTSRDNLRQAVADLLALTRSGLSPLSESLRVASRGAIRLDPNHIDYIGHSLGAILGVNLLAQAGGDIERAVLASPGGGILKLLDGSPALGPRIEAGLAAAGFTKGTLPYEQALGAIQTTIDTGEPLNYARAAAQQAQILMLEVVGGASSPPDQVVPNHVTKPYPLGIPAGTQPSPTAGTDPLARVMELQPIGPGNTPSAPGADTLVRFTAGEHLSVIDPSESPIVTAEMQRIIAGFLTSGTTAITDGSVVAQRRVAY